MRNRILTALVIACACVFLSGCAAAVAIRAPWQKPPTIGPIGSDPSPAPESNEVRK